MIGPNATLAQVRGELATTQSAVARLERGLMEMRLHVFGGEVVCPDAGELMIIDRILSDALGIAVADHRPRFHAERAAGALLAARALLDVARRLADGKPVAVDEIRRCADELHAQLEPETARVTP